jgi:hypothetical protein
MQTRIWQARLRLDADRSEDPNASVSGEPVERVEQRRLADARLAA